MNKNDQLTTLGITGAIGFVLYLGSLSAWWHVLGFILVLITTIGLYTMVDDNN